MGRHSRRAAAAPAATPPLTAARPPTPPRARPLVTEKLKEYPRFAAADAAVAREGAKVVLLLRLSPLFPFNL